MLQIDFFDKDIVSTLLPVNTMKPDKLCFLIDKRIITGKEVRHVEEAIEHMLPETELEFRPVDVDDFDDIYRELMDIINQNDDAQYIDLTGGTELMTACGYRAAVEKNLIPIYVDVRREHVLNVITSEVIKNTEHISLDDCLNAVGAKRLRDSKDTPEEEDYEKIKEIGEVIFSNVNAWQKLCQHIANAVSGNRSKMTVKVRPDDFGRESKRVARLCEAFSQQGFWRKIDPEAYRFGSEKYKSYMTTFGTWLELYIYVKAKEVFGDAELGVVIDWYEGDNIDTQDNEIDVLVMKKSSPIFISCKMRKPVSADLYEVGYLADRLGGGRSKALLATTFPVKELGTSPKRMYQRMRKLRIGVIETDSFKDQKAADVFNYALQMTE